jgi:hypothetical protein
MYTQGQNVSKLTLAVLQLEVILRALGQPVVGNKEAKVVALKGYIGAIFH